MSTISSGTTLTTALVQTGDTTGELVLKTNGTTTAVTIGTDQVVTLAQPLPAASGGTGLSSFPAPGTTGNLLTSNGTAWTSTAPAPSGGSFTATASGSLSATVASIVNANGTVSNIVGQAYQASTPQDNGTAFGASAGQLAIAYDPVNLKVVVGYTQSGSAKAIVGTLSGTTITWGSPVTIGTANGMTSVVHHAASGSMVFAYSNTSTNYRIIAGTVSGTSISFGSSETVQSGGGNTSNGIHATYDPTSQAILCIYRGGSNYSKVRAASISGTTITLGSEVALYSSVSGAGEIAVAADPVSGKCIGAARDASGNTVVFSLSISGTTITLDSNTNVVRAASSVNTRLAYLKTGVVCIFYTKDQGGGAYQAAMRTMTLSGTTFTLSSEVRVDTTNYGIATDLVYDSVADRIVTFTNTQAVPYTGQLRYYSF
jgi:hypothetical protein